MWQMFISKFSRDWNISQPVLKRRDKVHGVLFWTPKEGYY